MSEPISLCAKAGGALSRDQARLCDQVCEAAKEVCKQTTANLVASCEHEPCLQSCACDGTPIQVSLEMQAHLPNGRLIKRGGKASHEFLVASQFTRFVNAKGEALTALLVRDPLPLTHGKAVLRIVEASLSQWRSLRQHGHLGPVVQHYCWDRLGWSALRRRVLQMRDLLEAQWGGGEGQPSSSKLCLLEWTCFNACALHDAQNAFRWSLKPLFDDVDLLKAVYLGVASVRNSSDLVAAFLGEWVCKSLENAGPFSPAEKQLWSTVWATLGLKDDVALLLVDTLQLRYTSTGKLAVARDATGAATTSEVCAALMAIWNIPMFSDSRWLTVGTAAKRMVASHLTGMTGFFNFAAKKPSVKMYYLGGFLKMKAASLQFLVQAALVGAVPQAAQLAVLKDSRVAMTAPALKSSLAAAIASLAALPAPVWATLATVGGMSMDELRAKCLAAAHKAYAFFQFRVLDEADKLPWTLCRGDVKANLIQLGSRPRPSHPEIAVKAWDLLEMGYPLHTLCRMVLLLGETPWSTAVVEQLHGSAACISRLHPEYGLNTLLSRSMALVASKLLPRSNPAEKEVAKRKVELAKLDRRNPHKVGGRQFFFQDLVRLAKHKYDGSNPSKLRQVRRTIMKKHGTAWASASDERKRTYTARAKSEASKKKRDTSKRRETVVAALQAAQAEVAKMAQTRPPLTLSSAMWGPSEVQLHAKLMKDDRYNRVNMLRLRSTACEAPPPMSCALEKALDSQRVIEEEPRQPEPPAWIRTVAKHREDMDGCAFLCKEIDGSSRVFQFVFAMISPLFVSVSELKPVDVYVPTIDTGFHDVAWPRTDFLVDCQVNMSAARLADWPVEQISVLEGLVHKGSFVVSSRWTPVPLQVFLLRLPPMPAGQGASSSHSSVSKHEKLEPWAEKLLEKREAKLAQSSVELPLTASSEDLEDEGDICDELEWEKDPEYQALLQQYKDVLNAPGHRQGDFKVAVLSGQWQLQHKGVFADAFSASARGEDAPEWCQARRLRKSARYELSVYGEHVAGVLARAWAGKMQYMFNLCCSQGDTVALTAEQLAGWQEPSDLTQVAQNKKVPAILARRIRQIRELKCDGCVA